MHSLHIEQFETHYRLPPSRLSERDRLNAVAERMLQTILPVALQHAGISDTEIVCLREVRIPLHLRLSSSDDVLAESWAERLAATIRDAESGADSHRTEVIRYATQQDAIIDLALGVASGDLNRAWAWRQIGLTFLSEDASPATALDAMVSTLTGNPEVIVSCHRQMAVAGQLEELVKRVPSQQWQLLAATAAEPLGLRGIDIAGTNPFLIEETLSPEPALLRIREQSEIIQVARKAAPEDSGTSRSLALLGILEAEPSLMLRPERERARLLDAVSQFVAGTPQAESASMQDVTAPEEFRAEDTGSARELVIDCGNDDAASDELPTPPFGESLDEDWQQASPHLDSISNTGMNDVPEIGRQPDPFDESFQEPAADLPADRTDIRLRSQTAAASPWGGLVFLLSVVDRAGLPAEIVASKVMRQRSFSWVMFQLARLLLEPHRCTDSSDEISAVADDDPAVLTFCGLRPGLNPPSLEEPPPGDDERNCLIGWRHLMVAALRRRFTEGAVEFDFSPQEIVTWTCARRAEFVADPGWTEVRFSQDAVSTELRRCGLDLDPGYIPWLGLVVKYVYS